MEQNPNLSSSPSPPTSPDEGSVNSARKERDDSDVQSVQSESCSFSSLESDDYEYGQFAVVPRPMMTSALAKYDCVAFFGTNPKEAAFRHTQPWFGRDHHGQPVFIKIGYTSKFTRDMVENEIKKTLLLSSTPEYEAFRRKNGARLRLPEISEHELSARRCFMVVPNMGNSLEFLHKTAERLMSPRTVARLGARLVAILEYIHGCGFIHCDVHVGNVLIEGDLKKDYTTTLMGLKWAESYRDRNGQQVPQRAVEMHETSYRSLCHASFEKRNFTRKDDLEMVGWIMIDIQRHELPWRRRRTKMLKKDKQREEIQKLRYDTGLSKTVQKLHLLPVFQKYMESVLALGFEEVPDYNALKKMLLGVI